MRITHDTTIEEYEAWLATNPPISLIKRVSDMLFREAFRLIGSIGDLIKRITTRTKTRSSLAGKRVIADVPGHAAWLCYISDELDRTTRHLRRHESFDLIAECKWCEKLYANRHRLLQAKLEEELAMEELYITALEHLQTK